MTDWHEPERCRICANTDKRDLEYGLVHWKEAEPGMAFEHVPRCRDRDACRARVLQAEMSWPLKEGER